MENYMLEVYYKPSQIHIVKAKKKARLSRRTIWAIMNSYHRSQAIEESMAGMALQNCLDMWQHARLKFLHWPVVGCKMFLARGWDFGSLWPTEISGRSQTDCKSSTISAAATVSPEIWGRDESLVVQHTVQYGWVTREEVVMKIFVL